MNEAYKKPQSGSSQAKNRFVHALTVALLYDILRTIQKFGYDPVCPILEDEKWDEELEVPLSNKNIVLVRYLR